MSVIFGAPELFAGGIAAFTVTSGQPIVVGMLYVGGVGAPSLADTFATPYTWTELVSVLDGSTHVLLYIGTDGAGATGDVVVSYPPGSGGGVSIGVGATGASTASGVDAVDSSGTTPGGSYTNPPAPSLTPSTAGDGYVAFGNAQFSFNGFTFLSGNLSTSGGKGSGASSPNQVLTFTNGNAASPPTAGVATTAVWEPFSPPAGICEGVACLLLPSTPPVTTSKIVMIL